MGIMLPSAYLSSMGKLVACFQNIDIINYHAFGSGIFTIAPKILNMLDKMQIINHVGKENIFMDEDEVFCTSAKALDEAGSFVRNMSYRSETIVT